MNADNHGEGGIFALYALVRRYKSKWIIYPAIIGCASLIADGFITPPISVSSAVEGLSYLGNRWGIDFTAIQTVPIILSILIVLFVIQQFGTNTVGKTFGPIMILWFSMIACLGFMQVYQYPAVLKALNPYYALQLVTTYKGELLQQHGFWLLGSVFLCTTGGEALYSDLGHCGKQNIRISWNFVFVALMLSYLGQAAYLLHHFNGQVYEGKSTFYALMPTQFLPFGIAIATMATIIASQALISGCFTLVNEAMKLKLWPKMKVEYPTQLKGQIYIPSINWFLLIGCIVVVLIFRESSNMEAAYGLAIVLNMLMTTALLLHYYLMKHFNRMTVKRWIQLISLGILLGVVEFAFLCSNLDKFTHGGWFSVSLAVILFFFIFCWYEAKQLRKKHSDFVEIKSYLPMFKDLMVDNSLPKTATNLVYMSMSNNANYIDANILYSIFRKHPKRADIYWFVHIDTCDDPYAQTYRVTTLVPQKIFFIRLKLGFKIDPKVNFMFSNIVKIMQDNGEVDEISHYPSLRKHNLPADFKFILLNSYISVDDDLSPFSQVVVRVYRMLKKLSLPTYKDFGLEIATIEDEIVPIHVARIKPITLYPE